MIRKAWINTAGTGRGMEVRPPEGLIQMETREPHGVLILVNGKDKLSVSAESLPYMARYFWAAALLCGVDLNEGWEGTQEGGPVVPEVAP